MNVKIGEVVTSSNGTKIIVEKIYDSFITGREVGFEPSPVDHGFRILSFDNFFNQTKLEL